MWPFNIVSRGSLGRNLHSRNSSASELLSVHAPRCTCQRYELECANVIWCMTVCLYMPSVFSSLSFCCSYLPLLIICSSFRFSVCAPQGCVHVCVCHLYIQWRDWCPVPTLPQPSLRFKTPLTSEPHLQSKYKSVCLLYEAYTSDLYQIYCHFYVFAGTGGQTSGDGQRMLGTLPNRTGNKIQLKLLFVLMYWSSTFITLEKQRFQQIEIKDINIRLFQLK